MSCGNGANFSMQPDDLAVILGDRGVVEIEGADAAAFLDRILTVDVSDLLIGGSRYGALLSPQGKILAEAIFARRTETSFVADLALAALPGFLQRLTLMKLRAALTLRDRSDAISIGLGKGGAFDYMDPRPWPTGSPFAFRTRFGMLRIRGLKTTPFMRLELRLDWPKSAGTFSPTNVSRMTSIWIRWQPSILRKVVMSVRRLFPACNIAGQRVHAA
jgi:hypothetical protein